MGLSTILLKKIAQILGLFYKKSLCNLPIDKSAQVWYNGRLGRGERTRPTKRIWDV